MKSRSVFFCALMCSVFIQQVIAQTKPDALELYKAGRYEEAVRICMMELTGDPKNMDSYTVIGWSLIELGRYQESLEYAEKGLEISRGDYRIIEIAGEAQYYLQQYSEALAYFEEAVVLALTDWTRIDDVYYFMGECFINLREYNNADIAVSTSLHFQPNIAIRWARLGYAREMAGSLRWSLDAYDRALQLNSSLREAREGRRRVEQKVSSSQ